MSQKDGRSWIERFFTGGYGTDCCLEERERLASALVVWIYQTEGK